MSSAISGAIDSLWLYPIKGCRGLSIPAATLAETGLEVNGIGDREWVVVDEGREFVSQRELPKMALIQTQLTASSLRLRAPGMLQLDVPFESEGDVLNVRVWNDEVAAVTQGDLVDTWFSQYLGIKARLMRFDPEAKRLANRRYTGVIEAPFKFADAFPLLLCSTASLADLNARLAAKKQPPITLERFRPNIVLGSIEAFDEDYVDRIEVNDALLAAVKPCVRCTVPNVDFETGIAGVEPGDTLAVYRNDAKAGGITFGINAVIESGAGARLAAGDTVTVSLRL